MIWNQRRLAWIGLFPSVVAATTTTTTKEEKQCSIFIAPSSLRGSSAAGFGVYTTRDIAENEPILSGPPGTPDGPALPVVDPNHDFNEDYAQWNNVFGHYWWGRGVPSHTAFEAESVMDFQITFGALPNHHCALGSLDMHFPEESAYDDSLSNRFEDPGAGAYSYHRGRIFFATRALPAGSELFLSYGYCSRYDLEHAEHSQLWYPEWAHSIPMNEDFSAATDATRLMWNELLLQHHSKIDQIPDNERLAYEGEHYEHLTSHSRALLPSTTTELKRLILAGRPEQEHHYVSVDEDELTRDLALTYGTTPRTADWVREHGLCIEHLIPGVSTLPQAGRGAFAQHTIRAGEMVVPVPLLHIMDKRVLYLVRDSSEVTEWLQLLINYCFSHRESSFMLCPTSNAILINHCSDRSKKCGPDGPNAMIRWAQEDWDPRTAVWLHGTMEEMQPQRDRLLAMEVVALRDIQPGDEVFIDYGPEWETAWNEHVQAWQPPDETEEGGDVDSHFEIAAANQAETLDYLVSGSLRDEADHPYIFTGCLYWSTEMDQDPVYQEPSEVDFEEMSDEDIMRTFSDDGSMFEGPYARTTETSFWPCAVLYQEATDESSSDSEKEGRSSEPTYVVRITQHPNLEPEPWHLNEMPRILRNFPRSSIRYFAKPYRSDAFLYDAFRHPIAIPDDMFPKQWKNWEGGVVPEEEFEDEEEEAEEETFDDGEHEEEGEEEMEDEEDEEEEDVYEEEDEEEDEEEEEAHEELQEKAEEA